MPSQPRSGTAKPRLVVVAPFYNEQEVLPETAKRLTAVLDQLKRKGRISPQSHLLFVDDGSEDGTWNRLKELKKRQPSLAALRLSRNCGHQNALMAGLMAARTQADCVISIDGDLQQDENAIPAFVEKYREGYDLVYGVRKNRSTDSFFKRATAEIFYRFMHMLGVRVIRNHADYRLASRRALDALAEHGETMLFLRGIFTTLGFKSTVVYHDVRERYAGASKYSVRKMMSFALNGITSFTFSPIRFVSFLGLGVVAASIVVGILTWLLTKPGQVIDFKIILFFAIYFLGGVQLVCLGVIGEYVGKVYVEVKKRPKYIVAEEF
ncbi:MAG: glycosyltransferase family 2 protein [candidate division FCPU426 bacterium]